MEYNFTNSDVKSILRLNLQNGISINWLNLLFINKDSTLKYRKGMVFQLNRISS